MGCSLDNQQLQEFKSAKAQNVETIILPAFNYVLLNKNDALQEAFDKKWSKSNKDEQQNSVFFTISWDDPGNHIFVEDYPEVMQHKNKVIIGDGIRFKLLYVKTEKILFDGEQRICTMITLETEVNTLEEFKQDNMTKKKNESIKAIQNKSELVKNDTKQ